ncbi:hypothetical protein GLAREA_12993 [Glarea lozoyensis ATCC 20868]|uniref:Helix-turn-helix domain-containing protein n=1 Tax=Glarea lozoyensis (strain ATCC 20868 / MF5171) TaxID=1116229 RepID=S3CXF0_GLAL2|nr:uncharacterized protein GLAREA_12993 [Glarea lozoyensis ATCC 20868]EPE30270.1 hypothetical protein GLAREA_12993 [Glarea lozoyensis ATCC 20868]
MGASTSKAASAAKNAAPNVTSSIERTAARKYPTRSPPRSTNTQPSQTEHVGPTVHPDSGATGVRDASIHNDASDPQLSPAYAARLARLGPVQPNPTQSNSSTFNSSPHSHPETSTTTSSSFQPSASTPSQSIFPSPAQNPAISLLTARYRLAEEAETEFEGLGRKGSKGRSFLDVSTLRQVLILRAKGMREGDIERALELKRGTWGGWGGGGCGGCG